MILDSKQTYFDAEGNRLAGGRLRFFLHATTTPATVYADQEHNTPVEGSVALTSAGWTPFELFSDEDLDVRADKFLGLDEFGLEIYQEVKAFRYIPAGTVGTSTTASMAIVETIADLRALSTSFDSATVLGYYVAGDCPVRTYNVKTSAATENGGTIINSTFDPSKKWEWTPDCDEIDNRTFGVIANPSTTINSQLSAYLNYCESNNKTAEIVAGTYNLTAGSLNSGARIHAKHGVRLQRGITLDSNQDHWYFIGLTNPDTVIEGSFASTCCRLTINGTGWERTKVPLQAFHYVARGYSHGTGNFHLAIDTLVPSGQLPYFEQSCSLYTISSAKDLVTPIYISNGVTVAIDHLEGPGQLSFNQTNVVPTFRELRTSLVTSRVAQCMVATTSLIHLDSAVTLYTGADVMAYVEASGAGTLNTPDGSCKMRGGYGGKPNFILTGYGLDVGYHSVQQDYFASADCLVRTWNLSSGATGILDMGRAVSTETVSRAGTVYNGTIGGVSSGEIVLDRVVVTGQVLCSWVEARDSKFTNSASATFPNLTGSKLTNCSLSSSAPTVATNAVWREVSVTGHIFSNGSARLRDVFVSGNAILCANSSGNFGNFSWEGGSATMIDFNATQSAAAGTGHVAYNVTITGVIYLINGIKSTNSTSKAWAISGHYNVNISSNERGGATRGCGRYAYTARTLSAASHIYWGYLPTSQIFLFNKTTNSNALLFDGVNLMCSQDAGAGNPPTRGNNYSGHVFEYRVFSDQPDKCAVGFWVANTNENSITTGQQCIMEWVVYK